MKVKTVFCTFLAFLFISIPLFAMEKSTKLDKKQKIILEYRKMYSKNGDYHFAETNFFIVKKFI